MGTSSGLWTAGFGEIGASLKALEDAGVTLEHLTRLRTDKAYALAIGAYMKNGADAVPTSDYPIAVDYGRTLEVAIAAGNFGWKHSDITSEHFPSQRTGQADLVIRLIHLDRDIETDAAIAELDKLGLRPADLPELLAFGEKYPDVQRQFPVVALGSVWQRPDGRRNLPCLGRSGSGRDLDLVWDVFRWYRVCRFAAVNK